MPEAEAAADSIIEQARLQGGGRVSGHWEKVRAGQAGRRIIEEAQDMRAAAVVMTLPRRVAGTSVFGKTIGGNSVLLLADGSDAVLAYFRGEGPAPAANG